MAGRPRLYDSPEQLQEQIDAYFQSLIDEETGERSLPTVAGLNYFLGFEDRHGLHNYERYDEFHATVKRARLRLEQELERQLYRPTTVTGIIFNLKNNFGWKDEQKLEHTGDDGGPVQIVINRAGE